VRGVAAIGLTDRASLYWTARASLVASRADLDTFDATFDAWFRSLRLDDGDELSFEFDLPPDPRRSSRGEDASPTSRACRPPRPGTTADEDDWPTEGEDSALRLVASAVEILRSKSFAYLNEEERQRVAKLIRELRVHVRSSAPVGCARPTKARRSMSAGRSGDHYARRASRSTARGVPAGRGPARSC
jgi:uncharacterized protein with von Willebrand factor type A (vWA) domain